jgi:hypothetical protein
MQFPLKINGIYALYGVKPDTQDEGCALDNSTYNQ